MWVAENFSEITTELEKVNCKNNAKSLETYDFSTLYTTLPLTDLNEKLAWCIGKAFNGSKQKFLSIYQNVAKWVNKPRDSTLAWDEDTLKKAVKYLIFHSYIKIGDKIFLQIIGIGIGSDPAPFMANLYLFSYEFAFMEQKTKTNYSIARKLSKTKRFIDDLISINGSGNMAKFLSEIYPDGLQPNRENSSFEQATFLELNIEIKDKQFVTSVYDKRDDFPFAIVQYPSTLSNIPDKIQYNVFISQTIRYIRVCNRFEPLKNRITLLASKLKSKGAKNSKIKFSLNKCASRCSALIFEKFGKTVNEFTSEIFSA